MCTWAGKYPITADDPQGFGEENMRARRGEKFSKLPGRRQTSDSSNKGRDTRADLLGGESTRRDFIGSTNEGNLGRKTLLGG